MAFRLNYRLLLVIAVFSLGVFLRFYNISNNPPGIIQDEAALGYNAYSILKTGKDEYKQILPLAFRSFADYKLPLYVYLTVVPVKIWGLSVFSLRFASAFAGSMSTLLVYQLSRELFGKKRFILAATCMALFAISPWSIFFSRGGHEANVGLFLFLLGLWSQLVAFKKDKPVLLFLSAILFALTTYSYIAFKFISLIIFPLTFILFRRKKFHLFLALALFLALSAPQYYLMKFAAGSNRISSLYDSERVISRYLSYFSPRSLFFDPDPDRNKSLPNLSAFYPWMVAPYLIGLFVLLKSRTTSSKLVLLAVLAVSPIPAAIAKDPFSNIRALPLVFPLTMVIGLGLEGIIARLPKKVSLIVVTAVLLISGMAWYRNYFVLLPNLRHNDWLYGYQQLATIIKNDYPSSKILFYAPRGVYYVELLFFSQYPPDLYQKENIAAPLPNYYNNLTYDPVHKFGNFETRPINWGLDSVTDQIIVVGPVGVSPLQAKEHYLKVAFTVTGPGGEIIFTGYQTQPEVKRTSP